MHTKNRPIVIMMAVIAALLVVTPYGAEAGCKTLQPSGPLICASWITGSEVCELLVKNMRGNLAEGAWIRCGVFGTYLDEFPTATGEFELECDPSFWEPDYFGPGCNLKGRSACLNPEGKYNENGTSFNLPGPLFENTAQAQCSKGKCFTSAELEPEDTTGICNNNWTLTFTAERFFGQVCVCPGGDPIDSGGQCCADNKRDKDGNCVNLYNVGADEGEPDCLVEYCEYSGTFADYVFGQPNPGAYNCVETNPDAS